MSHPRCYVASDEVPNCPRQLHGLETAARNSEAVRTAVAKAAVLLRCEAVPFD